MRQKYEITHHKIGRLIEQIKAGDIVIPEIQRPFVWDNDRVVKLVESLYKGYPIGYIVTSRTEGVSLKTGTRSSGQVMIIDGQQRITALSAALLGMEVTQKDYSKKRIKISFNPKTGEFKVFDATIQKDKSYIQDISEVFSKTQLDLVKDYCASNQETNPVEFMESIAPLANIVNRDYGEIELAKGLDLDDVTEIFNRINSQGIALKEVDFVMSKISSNESYNGNLIYKTIHHFCEVAISPSIYKDIERNDKEFSASKYLSKISWLKNENDDIYDPTYEDMLRVIFTFKFMRGKMGDFAQLVSGRNFATRNYEERIKEDTYRKLADGVELFINETNFKNFIMIISSAGFCVGKLIRSSNAMNFSYALYLHLRSIGFKQDETQRIVRKWFVMSMLTGRYSSFIESRFENDMKQIAERGIEDYFSEVERLELSDNFWESKLIVMLSTSGTTNAPFNVFLASQCKKNAKGFLSTDITVRNMIEEKGDVHHIFPKQFLKEKGFTKVQYNQVANYAYVQTEINIKIGKKSPDDYFGYVFFKQCNGGQTEYGGIKDIEILKENMKENCIPHGLETMNIDYYLTFCEERRVLMAKQIKSYYYSL